MQKSSTRLSPQELQAQQLQACLQLQSTAGNQNSKVPHQWQQEGTEEPPTPAEPPADPPAPATITPSAATPAPPAPPAPAPVTPPGNATITMTTEQLNASIAAAVSAAFQAQPPAPAPAAPAAPPSFPTVPQSNQQGPDIKAQFMETYKRNPEAALKILQSKGKEICAIAAKTMFAED